MERCGWTHTDDIVLWAKRVYHSLVPVTSEPLNDHLHREPETTVNTPTTTSAVSVQYFNHMLQLNMVKELLGLWIFVNIRCVNRLCWIAPSQIKRGNRALADGHSDGLLLLSFRTFLKVWNQQCRVSRQLYNKLSYSASYATLNVITTMKRSIQIGKPEPGLVALA